MSVVRARVTLALAYLCMQCMTRVHVEINCKEKIVHFIFIAPFNSQTTKVFVYNLHITIFSRAYSLVIRVYLYITRMYSYVTRV